MNDTALSTEVIEAGKPLALLSYASMLVGLPLFLIPMLTPGTTPTPWSTQSTPVRSASVRS